MKKLMIFAFVAFFTLAGSMVMAQPPQGGERKMPTTEERVEQLKEQLDLNGEQCAQITEMMENRKMPERGNREAMQKMMEEEKKAMSKILNEKQYKKWEKLQSQQRPQGGRQ